MRGAKVAPAMKYQKKLCYVSKKMYIEEFIFSKIARLHYNIMICVSNLIYDN